MKRSFGVWLVAVFTISILVPLMILSTTLAVYFNHTLVAESDNLFSSTLFSVSQNITTYIEDLGRISMTPYFQSEMMGHLNDLNNGRYFESPIVAVRINKHYQLSISQQLSASRRDVMGILFAPYSPGESHCFLVQRYSSSLLALDGLNARETDWYQGALAADGGIYFPQISIQDYYEARNNNYFYTGEGLRTISVARLIKDPSTMRPVGVMKVDAVDTVIRDIFQRIPTSYSSALMLLDQNNNIIYSANSVSPTLLQGLTADTRYVSGDKDGYYVSMAPIASTPWKLCYFASERDINQKTAAIYYVVALMGAVCLAVAMLSLYANSRYTVRSMNEILPAMQRIASGDLDIRLNLRRGGYLGIIADALNQTAARLDQHIKSEYKAVLNQRNAEYLALQSQINPHFLNNVLSGFVTLNRIGQRDTLESSILQLSHLFRYVSKNKNLSTVGSELDFLEEYLSLQKMRFADRLRYSLNCSPEAEKIMIPKLLLQPLVENSVIHGMEPYDNDLFIEILAEVADRGGSPLLLLVIRDNGAGFDAGSIGPDSIGLSNIMERLELFRLDAAFQIRSAPGKGCLCAILMPLEGEEKETC